MERVLEVRRPLEQSQLALSRASRIFFGCDIFQVIAVVVFQSSMIALGDFSAYNNTEHPGMGPGRRIYMAIFMGAVVYTCFLCLFAVKRQNFMEIVAFDLQNFGFVTYSFIQLYHVGFKKYNGLRTSENDVLPKIVIANATTLLFLSVVFTYLSYKLYMEFGWKIYKRVRFNNKLRGVYQIYELLSCLLKMDILYWGMFAICHSLVLLRDTHNILFFLSLSFIPLSFIYAALGFYATRRENRYLMIFFLTWSLAGIGYFFYKLYGFITRKCGGCEEFEKNGKDIPQEAFMHFVYLGTINLVVVMAIFAVALKSYLNFGGGLAEHFNRKMKSQSKLQERYALGLGRGSHCYPEESVISVTSYEYDEFGESGRLERDLLHAALTGLSPDNRQNLANKRSCSLPNLLADPPQGRTVFYRPGESKKPVLSSRLHDEKTDSGSQVITCISEEKPMENSRRGSHGNAEKPFSEARICRKNTGETSPNACVAAFESPSNGNITPNFRVNGYVDKIAEHVGNHFNKDVALTPELKTNGHLIGKRRSKSFAETEVQQSCAIQTVYAAKYSCEDDKRSAQGTCCGENSLLQNRSGQRTVQLNPS